MARIPVLKPILKMVNTRIAVVPRADVEVRRAKPTEDFYGSAAWKAVRIEVQRASKRTCQGCGKTDTRIYVDHIIERRDGGAPYDRANLMALCAVCHGRKTARVKASRNACNI